jgi:bile acid-coenzyme A ligase
VIEELTLGQQFAALAEAHPRRVAVVDSQRSVTFRQLDERTNQMARVLLRHGVKQGDLVSICLPNEATFLDAGIAIWKVGAIPQPLNRRLPRPELDAILDTVRPSLVIGAVDTDHFPVVADLGSHLDELDNTELPPVISPHLKAPTSGGSTGRPKVIVSNTPATPAALLAAGRGQVDGDAREWSPLNPLAVSPQCRLLLGDVRPRAGSHRGGHVPLRR